MPIKRSLALALSCILAVLSAARTAAQETSSAAAIEQYRAAVAMQNRQMYDLASQEWITFLKEHGQDPLADKAKHYLGVCFFQQDMFEKSERSFAEAIKSHPNSELFADSLLNLGLSQFNRGQQTDQGQRGHLAHLQRAIKTLTRLTQEHRETADANHAYFYIAESHYALGELDEAADAYQRAVKQTQDKARRAKALFGYGVTLQDQGKVEQALRVFDELLKLGPDAVVAQEARMRRADALLSAGKFLQAQREFDQMTGQRDFAFADYVQLRLAAAQLANKDYGAAARSYANVLERFPDSQFVDEATLAAGKCFYLAKSYDQAKPYLARARQKTGNDAAEAAHWLARVELATGQPDRALAIAKSALLKSKNNPFEVELRIDQADAMYELPNRRADASQSYAEISERFPDHEQAPHARYMAAYAAVDAKQYDRALEHVNQFLDRHSKHKLIPDVLAIAAECKLQGGDTAEAGQVYAELATRFENADDADLWRVRAALCANMADEHAEVIQLLRGRTSGIGNQDLRGEAHFLLGAAYFEKGDDAKTARELQKSLNTAPQGAQADRAMLLLAKALRRNGQPDQAQRLLGDLAARFPDSKVLDRALLERAELLASRGNHKQAAVAYEKLIDAYADGAHNADNQITIDAIYGWGWSLIQAEDFPAAKQVFDKLLAMDSKHQRKSDCYYARAVVLQQLGEMEAALRDVDRFLNASSKLDDSALADAHYLRGLCLVDQKKPTAAVQSFKKALRVDPDYADADKVLYELAWAQQTAKQAEAAAATFRDLARQFPDSALAVEAIYRAAEADFAEKNYDSAAAAFAKAARRARDNAELKEQCLHKVGWSLFHLRQFDAAREAFAAQVQQFPSGPLAADCQLMLAECRFKTDDFSGALRDYQNGLQQPSDNHELTALAMLHAGQAAGQQKNWQTSLDLLNQLLKRFPKSSHALKAQYEKGWALQNLGQVEQAETQFVSVAEATNSVLGAKARFMQGEIQFLREDYEAAIRTFFKVAYGYGHPKSPREFHVWQANAMFEAARCCESTKRLDAAQKLYHELLETHPDCDKARDAKRKLEAIANR